MTITFLLYQNMFCRDMKWLVHQTDGQSVKMIDQLIKLETRSVDLRP